MAIGDSTESRRTPEQQAAAEQAEAQVIEVLTDLPLQEMRELAARSEVGEIITSSDGRRYKVNRLHGLQRLMGPDVQEKARAAQSRQALERAGVRAEEKAAKAEEKAAAEMAERAVAMQAERTIVLRVQNAVAKLAKEGMAGEDYLVVREQADAIARAKPVDQDLLTEKMQAGLDMVVSMLLTGQVKPRSAAEAISIGKTLAELLAFTKADAAAIGAQAAINASAMDSRTEYMQMLAELKLQTDAEKKKEP